MKSIKMKKVTLILLVNILILGVGFGQDDANHFSRKNAIKINPFGLGMSKFQLSYERFLGERNSSILISPAIILRESTDESISGWEVMGQYRFYLTHLRRDRQDNFLGVYNYGFYTGLYALYFNLEEDYLRYYWDPIDNLQKSSDVHKEIAAFEGGALLGLQVDVTKRILIDFYVGGGVKTAEVVDSSLDINEPEYPESFGVFAPEYKGVKPKIGFLLGITF